MLRLCGWLAGFLALLCLGLAGAEARESITRYHVSLRLQADGVLELEDAIDVLAEGNRIKRGIFIDFPVGYRHPSGLHDYVTPEILSVTRNGTPEPFNWRVEGDNRRLYIGNPEVVLPHGPHQYRIRYRMTEAIGFFDSHDELYWNLIGTGWIFPIEKASATIHLPPGQTAQDVTVYTGGYGQQGKDYRLEGRTSSTLTLTATRPFEPEEGMTMVLELPKGSITPPSAVDRWKDMAQDNLGSVLGLAMLLGLAAYYMRQWVACGQDPEGGIIIPLFDPPEHLCPAGVGYVQVMGFRPPIDENRAFTVGVTSLAVRGLLTIHEEKTVLHRSYILQRTDAEPAMDLPATEAVLYRSLFQANSVHERTIGPRYDRAIATIKEAFVAAIKNSYSGRYFRMNRSAWWYGTMAGLLGAVATAVLNQPPGDRMISAGMGALVLFGISSGWLAMVRHVVVSFRTWREGQGGSFLPLLTSVPLLMAMTVPWVMLILGIYHWESPPTALIVVGMAWLCTVFFRLLEAPTPEGRALMDKIAGYKQFLTTTEWDRLTLREAPTPDAALFEKHLPYSMALGVDEAWSRAFMAMARAASLPPNPPNPHWYHGSSGRRVDFSDFASDFGSNMSSAISSSSTAPSSSSGSGGSGSSGGGGGSRGGGGW